MKENLKSWAKGQEAELAEAGMVAGFLVGKNIEREQLKL